jgi:hypothetical protein
VIKVQEPLQRHPDLRWFYHHPGVHLPWLDHRLQRLCGKLQADMTKPSREWSSAVTRNGPECAAGSDVAAAGLRWFYHHPGVHLPWLDHRLQRLCGMFRAVVQSFVLTT